MSYVVVLSGSSELSLMLGQYHLWRTARAVSIVLLILFFEAWAAALIFTDMVPVPVGVASLGLSLTLLITKETYSRLCFTLFALVYVTQNKREVELKN